MNRRARTAGPTTSRADDVAVHGPDQARPESGGRRARRTAVVVGAGILTAVALAAAVTLPILLDEENSSSLDAMREQLQQVATAQRGWHTEHGAYSTALTDLGITDPSGDLAIVRADDDSFCAGAYDSGTRSVLFFSSAAGFSTSACN